MNAILITLGSGFVRAVGENYAERIFSEHLPTHEGSYFIGKISAIPRHEVLYAFVVYKNLVRWPG